MAGIYIHIPFCKQACTYCDFHFTTSRKLMPQVVDALEKEMDLRRTRDGVERVSTLYFGGGTPSILPPSAVARLVEAVRQRFDLDREAEITLEANPDDISPTSIAAWRAAGINRLSIGIQSFRDEQLRWMNRAHDSKMALAATEVALAGGITDLSIDLIYGLPRLTREEWEAELDTAVGLGANHISAYCLTVEPRTALGHRVKKGLEKPVDEDAAADQFASMVTVLARAGFAQYEVSNFSKPGFESKHNTSYWRGEPYLGLGPAAHGFVGGNRYWNVANNARYIHAISRDELPETTEVLSRESRYNEWIMTGLRMREGIAPAEAATRFGIDFDRKFESYIARLVDGGLAERHGDRLNLTSRGLFLADGIASEFFL